MKPPVATRQKKLLLHDKTANFSQTPAELQIETSVLKGISHEEASQENP